MVAPDYRQREYYRDSWVLRFLWRVHYSQPMCAHVWSLYLEELVTGSRDITADKCVHKIPVCLMVCLKETCCEVGVLITPY